MARKLHTTLEPGDVILLPPGAGASVQFVEKSGRRSRVSIECDQPVTITRAAGGSTSPQSGATPHGAAPRPPIARRPVPSTG
jgi:hypothetical protein